jgi:hypothetical protein
MQSPGPRLVAELIATAAPPPAPAASGEGR